MKMALSVQNRLVIKLRSRPSTS